MAVRLHLYFLTFLLLLQHVYSETPSISSDTRLQEQQILGKAPFQAARPLTGKFLHITDIHPDPFYKIHSASDSDGLCHRGKGSAGFYGAETTDCDSPYTLVNATFRWIAENLRDSVDFVVWTGDSARHDDDDKIPRNEKQVIGENKDLVERMVDIFGKKNDKDFIPVVPTIGNNDITPHNIFTKGPNHWTKEFLSVWKDFIPEDQQDQFNQGAWFYTEVIPNKLAVFSLNTMYFFEKNSAVDGCADPEEPGYQHMEWLRIQLQSMRERGIKVIISGHVPPARTEDKTGWDESCWQKYALWMRQYRDVVVSSHWGHMNIDHFFFQDFKEIDWNVAAGFLPVEERSYHATSVDTDDDFTIESSNDYLISLRKQWSKLPELSDDQFKKQKRKKTKKEKYYESIGGQFAERFSLSLTSASVVPNYFPTLRVFEYNITGLQEPASGFARNSNIDTRTGDDPITSPHTPLNEAPHNQRNKKKKIPHNQDKHQKPNFTVPDAPSKSSPPGPAYSPQTFSLLGYTQYFANLTTINNEPDSSPSSSSSSRGHTPHPRAFNFEVEYDTRDKHDPFGLQDGLIVRNMVKLAARIGRSKAGESSMPLSSIDQAEDSSEEEEQAPDLDTSKHKNKKKKKHHKKKKRRIANKAWFAFVQRAYVGTVASDRLEEKFGDEVRD